MALFSLTPSVTRSYLSHHAFLLSLCSLHMCACACMCVCVRTCVRVCVCVYKRTERKKESKEPRGELACLLQTTSQGHSRREIKLQPNSEGVSQNVYAHTNTFPHSLKPTLWQQNIAQCDFINCKIIILYCTIIMFSDAFYWRVSAPSDQADWAETQSSPDQIRVKISRSEWGQQWSMWA